jgi:hypothetical protein
MARAVGLLSDVPFGCDELLGGRGEETNLAHRKCLRWPPCRTFDLRMTEEEEEEGGSSDHTRSICSAKAALPGSLYH